MRSILANSPCLGLIFSALVGWHASAQVPIGVAGPVEHSGAARVTIPFVTVRAIEQNKKGIRYYSQGRGDVSAGDCVVEPEARKSQQVIGARQRTLDEVLDALAKSDENIALYVHGYNTTFEQACHEAALLQDVTRLEGRLLLFTWPADGKVSNYLKDISDLEWSVLPLRNLLLTLTDRFGAERVDAIGHSLGARAVIDAVSSLSGAGGGSDPLGRLILIAPDVDSDIFRRDFSHVGELASAVTVYVSTEDRALKASRRVSGEPRLGQGDLDLSGLEGVDVVDVVQRRWTLKAGHTYHLQNQAVADDLREVLFGAPRTSGARLINAR
jgi:esterase/lipase superfamily enzyme